MSTDRTPCADADPELWFAERPAELYRAKALCAQCPIKAACLAAALERREPWGVWGGEILQQGIVLAYKRGRGRPSNADRRLGLVTRVADQPVGSARSVARSVARSIVPPASRPAAEAVPTAAPKAAPKVAPTSAAKAEPVSAPERGPARKAAGVPAAKTAGRPAAKTAQVPVPAPVPTAAPTVAA